MGKEPAQAQPNLYGVTLNIRVNLGLRKLYDRWVYKVDNNQSKKREHQFTYDFAKDT